MTKKRIDLNGDVTRGDPAVHIIGKPEEKPARVHKPLPKKRKYTRSLAQRANDELRKDIGLMNELEKFAEEHEAIAKAVRTAIKALEVTGDE